MCDNTYYINVFDYIKNRVTIYKLTCPKGLIQPFHVPI